MKLLSNLFFVGATIVFLISIIFFEIGLRAMRRENEKKTKESNRLGIRFLILSGILFGLSGLTAFFV
ncbi:putative membrane protein [Thermosipho japonicus]|uniref:Putative membrane protein n=1 Tax=Thermosipho japonicus TaxID=90323 RepID=A0A841GES7_9BACT|nr:MULTISPECIES: hypothetical protein [Thermosipho]MBB6062062.1 putative membrane protein [Thermosipho japonicus]